MARSRLDNVEVLQASYTKHSFARHSHEEFTIGLIEGGGCEFCYRGDTHIAPPGSIVLINPGEVHDGSGADTARLTYRALYPAVDALQRIASEFAAKQQGLPYFRTSNSVRCSAPCLCYLRCRPPHWSESPSFVWRLPS
jgi:hypothetical protein